MRPIKFRVWDGAKMWYPRKDNCMVKIWDSKGKIPWGLFDNVAGTRLVTGDPNAIFNKPGVLMQWTGLKDKVSTDIYEGDILYDPNSFGCITGGDLDPLHRKVIWNDQEAKFELAFIEVEDYAKNFNPSGLYLCKRNCAEIFTVVGNIYQPPA